VSDHPAGCELCASIRDVLCARGPCSVAELADELGATSAEVVVHLGAVDEFALTNALASRLPTPAGARSRVAERWVYRPSVLPVLYSPRLGTLGRLVCSTEHEPRRRIAVVAAGFLFGAIAALVTGAGAVAVVAFGLSGAAVLALGVQRFAQDPANSIGPGTMMAGADGARTTLHVPHVVHLLDTAGPDAAELAWSAALGEFGLIAINDELDELVQAAARADASHAGVSTAAAQLALELFDGDTQLAASLASAATGEDQGLIERWLRAGCGTIDRSRCRACAAVPAGGPIWSVTVGRQPA
jgi:hypothetical protein